MKSKMLLILIAINYFALPMPEANALRKYIQCDSSAEQDIGDAVRFIQNNMSEVRTQIEATGFNYHPRRGKRRRVKRRLRRGRKVRKLRFRCLRGWRPCWGFTGRHLGGAISNKIKLCMDKVRGKENAGLCRLVQTVSHELGHAVGIKADGPIRHFKRKSDRVYAWGRFWGQYCRDNGYDRPLRPAP